MGIFDIREQKVSAKPRRKHRVVQGRESAVEQASPLEYKLVQQFQAPGQPDHWSLFLARDCRGEDGVVYQVKGDAVSMRHMHAENINVEKSASFKTSFVIGILTEEHAVRVGHWAIVEASRSP